jgi:hypothetical protein
MRLRLLACSYNDLDMWIDPDTVYSIRPSCCGDAPKTRFKPCLFYFFLSPRLFFSCEIRITEIGPSAVEDEEEAVDGE